MPPLPTIVAFIQNKDGARVRGGGRRGGRGRGMGGGERGEKGGEGGEGG